MREQRQIRGMEAVAERPDGTLVHFVPYPTQLYDASGVLIGAVNMLVDISDRKRARACAATGINRRIIRRRDRQQGPQRHHKPVTILIPSDRMDEEPEILERIRRGERVDHYDPSDAAKTKV